MNFKELNINQEFIDILKKNGISTPTSVQEKCIPLALKNKDIISESQTGTGKTLAFLLPIFQNIDANCDDIQALILTPTRELAIQIANDAAMLAKAKPLNILAAYGGKDVASQVKKLNKKIHVLIATPGRLIDHINRNTVDLSKLKILVLDEADQMLLMGFKKEVEFIIKQTSKNHQTMCFSATIGEDVKKLADRYTKNAQIISIKNKNITLDNIKQEVVLTTDRKKQSALFKVLDEDNPFMAIIFCRTKVRADKLEDAMIQNGYNCKKIHSDVSQSKRETIMKSFRKADLQYLIATDVASRGLDISGVDHIYNYDMPENVETYIHRTGRTGRAGQTGYTCLFAAVKDMQMLKEIQEKIKFEIPVRFSEQ